MAKKIEGWPREFLARPRAFATLSTIAADGAPRSAVIWYTLRDEDILVNSAVGRAWPTNLLRDPRYSLSLENGYEWLGARGTAEAITDQAAAQADIAAMARRYYEPTKAERIITETFKRQERISFRLHVEAFAEHPDV